jgi:tRNA threonylcarbamoyl adenosine modification protein YeaZ
MKILALEFSSSRRSVAVVETASNSVLGAAGASSGTVTGMTLVQEALAQARLGPDSIDRIAVGLGPGSYTGIRSAIAISQGWQLGRSTPVCGIPSVDVLAMQALREGVRGEFTLLIDAQRHEFYRADFLAANHVLRCIRDLRIVAAQDAACANAAFGPDVAQLFPGARNLYPDAVELAKLAVNATPSRGEELEPIYLRAVSFVKAAAPRRIEGKDEGGSR